MVNRRPVTAITAAAFGAPYSRSGTIGNLIMVSATNRFLPIALLSVLVAGPVGLLADQMIGANSPPLSATLAQVDHRAEHAVMLGGILIERHRHEAAGALEGCTLGAIAGGITAVAIGIATGGAAFALVPSFVSIGCGIGAAGGVAVGYPLDDYLLDL
jgi:hypothetical protein